MKILVSAFEPFMNINTNSSYEIVKKINSQHELLKVYLPVHLTNSFKILQEKISEFNPDIIILCGQAASRNKISIETKAINLIGKSISNTDGITTENSQIIPNANNAYYSSFPTVEALSSLLYEDIPVELSNDAGTYICNSLFYQAMHFYPNIESVFIHFPLYKNQINDLGIELNVLIKGLETIINSL